MLVINHPKMRYTYVGIDSHKDTHTAVFLDCFFDKLGEIQFDNLPSKFGAFLADAEKLKRDGTELLFGLEDVSSYGRTLTVFLKNSGEQVKHVNAFLVARERKNQNITQKTDAVDAECAARVLLSKLYELPDADTQDKYWILRTLVVRRDFIVRNLTDLKNHLHSFLTQHYPNYRSFFGNIDCKSSLAFFMRYPSPSALKGTSLEELADFLYEPSGGRFGAEKAAAILESLEETAVQFQEERDMAVQSTIRQILASMEEMERLNDSLEVFLKKFSCVLTSMTGIEVVTAAKIMSCIGDIRKFPTPAKLARYSGIAPVSYSSGKHDMQFPNQRGNRELNSLFYGVAIRLIHTVGPSKKVINPFFYSYYNKKLSEGKTKRQALKCVQRRLVNIIWTMLTNDEEYVNPPMFDLPKE